MSDEKKAWEKPWSPREIAENASNWSFAADLGLLKYLEVFSEDLLNRAATIDSNVNTLLSDLSKASLSLDIAKNQFLSLSNTQFIESRVYEDDETLLSNEEKLEKEEPIKNNTEDFNKNEMRLAALRGIEVIEEFFNKVEVVDSDSEEDSDLTSFVLHPKDPYIHRPLPYVIGSEKWHKKLHVGLEDSSSESENEKVIENYSDTDSESDLPITNRSQAKSISGSGSSEADFSSKLDNPVANSTLNDTNKQEDFLRTSQEYNSVTAPVDMSQNSFAEQLAAKLGNVIKNAVEEPQINTKPIQKMNDTNIYRNFFSDEPPPLDDMNDEFSPKSRNQGIFSGGDGLFDDLNEDEPFWGDVEEKPKNVSNVPTKPTENLFEDENQAILTNPKHNDSKPNDTEKLKSELERKLNKKKEPSIFDEDFESDEDSLFGKPLSTSKKPIDSEKNSRNLFADDDESPASSSQRNKHSSGLFDEDSLFDVKGNNTRESKEISGFNEENSILSNDSSKRKAPIGGVKVITNPNLFAGQNIKKILKNRPASSSDSDNEAPPPVDEIKASTHTIQNKENSKNTMEVNAKSTEIEKPKSNNLFDDVDIEDDLFKDDLFSSFSSKMKKSSNLFGKSEGLFDDLDESDEEDPIVTKTVEDNTKKSKDELKRDTVEVKPVQMPDGNEEILRKADEKPLLKEERSRFSDVTANKTKVAGGIFSGDDESDSDDLFSSKHSKIISKNKIIEDGLPGVKSESKKIPQSANPAQFKATKSIKAPSLFDDDDDDIEDDLFSSNLSSNRRSAPTKPSMRPEQKAPLPRRKNLFDDDIIGDDVFSESKSNIEEKQIVSAKIEENRVDISVDDVIPPLIQPHSPLNDGEDDIFGKGDLKREEEEVDLSGNAFKGVQKNETVKVDDPLFGNEDSEDDLFGGGNDRNEERFSKSPQAFEETASILSISSKQEDKVEVISQPRAVDEGKDEILKEEHEPKIEISEKNNETPSLNEDPANLNLSVQNSSVPDREESKKEVEVIKESRTEIHDTSSNDAEPILPRESPQVNAKNPDEINENAGQSNRNIEGRSEGIQDSNSTNVENLSIQNKFSSTFVGRIPSLNIFDPDPPSDPDDWDDRSEQNMFGDDLYAFDNTDNFGENRSSIFDREPPSPAFNESSGIVRDHRSRLDTDASSFYPYATSSRRFSGEVFGEEQSNDSLFPSKNRHSVEPNIPPSIDESAEISSVSNLDVTPSGKLEDLYQESSEQSKPAKSVTFEDAPANMTEDDVFSKSDGAKGVEEEASPDKTLEENGEDPDGKKPKPTVPKKPESKKTAATEDAINKGEFGTGDGPPGKLKHNLNINVFALRPGAGKGPIFTKPPQRSVSLDLDDQTDGTCETPPPRQVKVVTPQPNTALEKIKDNLDNVQVLESITKTRARGPVKRRPSTKRGRDAIRNSCIDLTFSSNPTKEDSETEEKQSTETNASETRSFKNELQAKLLQNSKSFPPVAQAQNIESREVRRVNESNSTRREEISTYSRTTSTKSSPITEAIPKISFGTANSPVAESNSTRREEISTYSRTTSTKSSPIADAIPKISFGTTNSPVTSPTETDSRDTFTSFERTTKAEMRPEYAPKFAETSSSRIRRIDLIQQSKSPQQDRDIKSLFEGDISTKTDDGEAKAGSETSQRRLRRIDFFKDSTANEDDPFKFDHLPRPKSLFQKPEDAGVSAKTSASNRQFKRIDFLNDMMSADANSDKSDENKSDRTQTITTATETIKNTENVTESKAEISQKDDIKTRTITTLAKSTEDVFKKRTETSTLPSRKLNLFGDESDDDDDGLFSSSKSKKKNNPNTASFLSADLGDNSDLFDVARRSSFVKTDNFASPEFIKDNLSEDEENEDLFSEKKLPPKSDIFKRSSFVDDDDDDEDLLGETSKDKKKASTTTSITTRRLKVSSLKKLENVTVTGDDPLSALDK